MDEDIDLVDRQRRLFRQRYYRAAKDLDAAVHHLKIRREAAINALFGHQAAHRQ
jgi:hypothetical protein